MNLGNSIVVEIRWSLTSGQVSDCASPRLTDYIWLNIEAPIETETENIYFSIHDSVCT